jgi:hypothetical protein
LKDRVREVLLIGAAADRIAQELSGAVELIRAGNLESAVQEAFHRARPGDVVLLAPACSSFDQFQDYEHRGRVFKELVERLGQDVESGAVEWKGGFKQERASLGLDVSRQFPAQSRAGSSPEALEASPRPTPETPAAEVETPHLRPASDVRPGGEAENELSLVYEISVEEFPPAEVELAEDYSEAPETSQSRALLTPERIDDAHLPYEAGAEERGVAAGGSAGRDFAHGGTKGMSSSPEGNPAIGDRKKPKSAVPGWAPQSRPPRVD